jgi:hypothetical protein
MKQLPHQSAECPRFKQADLNSSHISAALVLCNVSRGEPHLQRGGGWPGSVGNSGLVELPELSTVLSDGGVWAHALTRTLVNATGATLDASEGRGPPPAGLPCRHPIGINIPRPRRPTRCAWKMAKGRHSAPSAEACQ